MKLKNIKKYIMPLVAIILFIIANSGILPGAFVRNVYQLRLNKWFLQWLSSITGLVPISLGEILLILHVLMVPVLIFGVLWDCLKKKRARVVYGILQYVSTGYLVFMLMWGLNYQSDGLAALMSLELVPENVATLRSLNVYLIEQANALSALPKEATPGHRVIFQRAQLGYDALSQEYSWLSGQYGSPKAIMLSKPMLYTGITGVFFPFTGEANVNIAAPELLLPSTVLHEMAHQRGIAPEDEANFVAYLTGIHHPDIAFQYSSAVLGLIHASNALYRVDPDEARRLRLTYSQALETDLQKHASFWRDYEGKVNETATQMNDHYLKANAQQAGVMSYGKMVDLMIAYYRQLGFIQ